jgi:hypothetical protein
MLESAPAVALWIAASKLAAHIGTPAALSAISGLPSEPADSIPPELLAQQADDK